MPTTEFMTLAENVQKLKSDVANLKRMLAKLILILGRAGNVTPVPPGPPKRGKRVRERQRYLAKVDPILAKVVLILGRAGNVTPIPPSPPKRGKVGVAKLARGG